MHVKNQTYVILALLFIVFISVFSVLNVSAVEVNYVFWKGESPLVIVILISVLLGGILTTAFGASKYIQLQRENKRLYQRINHLESVIEQQVNIDPNETEELDQRVEEERNDQEVE